MKNTIKILSLLMVVATSVMIGCKKEGCTDKDSLLYNEKAKKDDGSCKYEGKAVFWYDQAASTALVNDSAVSLTYYLEGTVIGSTAADVYWTGAPTCGQSGSVSVTKDLGSEKSKSYSFSVKDQTGFEYWKGTIAITGNTCKAEKLFF